MGWYDSMQVQYLPGSNLFDKELLVGDIWKLKNSDNLVQIVGFKKITLQLPKPKEYHVVDFSYLQSGKEFSEGPLTFIKKLDKKL